MGVVAEGERQFHSLSPNKYRSHTLSISWKVSLHGGHSSAYCDHAHSTLPEMLDAAVACGYRAFGVSEHAPRLGDRYLYPNERQLGWSLDTVCEKFEHYARDVFALRDAYADRIQVLCGFETEGVPHDRYLEIMLGYREKYGFEYMVGSIHHINDTMIDYDQATFNQLANDLGGIEKLAVRYYEAVAEMVHGLQPEVVGHFDLIRKCAPSEEAVSTPAIKRVAFRALEHIKAAGSILDINTAGYRKGLGRPYVAPWILDAAKQLEIPVCFGDDSHCAAEVGAGVDEARQYLIENGFTHVQCAGVSVPYALVEG
jgi:histidinol-phosphatase (PHP family)